LVIIIVEQNMMGCGEIFAVKFPAAKVIY